MARTGSATTEKWEIEEFDEKGWAPIHYAAHSGYFKTVNRLVEAKPMRLELRTQDKLRVTPLWLAFSEGRIETVDTLILYNADMDKTDSESRNVIDIAFINKQHKLLLYLMKKFPELQATAWDRLEEYTKIDFLQSGNLLVSLKIIVELSKDDRNIFAKEHLILSWISLLYKPDFISDNPAVEVALVNILQNMTGHFDDLDTKTKIGLFDVLTERLLKSPKRRVQNNILVILHAYAVSRDVTNDVIKGTRFVNIVQFMEACQDENHLLKTFEIVLRGLRGGDSIQDFFHQQTNLLSITVNILRGEYSDTLYISALKTLRHFAKDNKTIQKKLIEVNIFQPLKTLLLSKAKSVTKEISKLICATTKENKELQLYYIQADAIKHLSQQIKKMKNDALHECIVKALWDIGGDDHDQRLMVSRSIDMNKVFALTTSNSSEVLQYYGGEFLRIHLRLGNHSLSASSREVVLIHLLNSSLKSILMTSEMLTSALKTIQTLCTSRGHTPMKKIQKLAIEKNSVQVLLQASSKVENAWIELEVFQTISMILICQPNNMKILADNIGLPPVRILKHLSNSDPKIRSKASHVLACLLLDKENKEKVVKRFSLPLSFYNNILDLDDDYITVNTAFQLFVLKDFISESSGVETSVIAIELLRKSLANSSGDIIAKAGDHISGIAQYCPGMKAVFTTAGLVDVLCDLMRHDDDSVKTSVAVAICVLARCLKAEILLLKRCRQEEGLVQLIEDWTNSIKLPQHFKERWVHYMSLNIEQIVPEQCELAF